MTPMAKTTVQVLKEARSLIAAGFAQDSYAKDGDGCDVDAMNDAASCFCTLGALARVEGFNTWGPHERGPSDMYLDSEAVREITQTLVDLGGDVRGVEREENRVIVVPHYNDSATQEQILQVFDITINRLESQ